MLKFIYEKFLAYKRYIYAWCISNTFVNESTTIILPQHYEVNEWDSQECTFAVRWWDEYLYSWVHERRVCWFAERRGCVWVSVKVRAGVSYARAAVQRRAGGSNDPVRRGIDRGTVGRVCQMAATPTGPPSILSKLDFIDCFKVGLPPPATFRMLAVTCAIFPTPLKSWLDSNTCAYNKYSYCNTCNVSPVNYFFYNKSPQCGRIFQ